MPHRRDAVDVAVRESTHLVREAWQFRDAVVRRRSGAVRPHSHLQMAKFTQHFEDVLDLEQNALEWIHALYPKTFTKLEMARTWLGRYGCTAKQQEMPMKQLSDGQKARIVFAKLAMDKPHLLMLDEPTNHLQGPVSRISPFRNGAFTP